MGACVKPSSPTYYWVDVVAELQDMVAVTDPLWQDYFDLFHNQFDFELLTVLTFCSGTQPSAIAPDISQYEDGSYKQMVADYAKAHVYYKLCQDC